MAEKVKYFDRIMSKRGLSKFDTSLLSNDGGKYSPSIRRLRQHYFHDTKSLPRKISSSSSTQTNDCISPSSKCDDCQKHDGLFQCCHCNQRLCIRCCNKHYKKVTNELDYLNDLSDRLLTKIFYMKTDLEKQKNETIEQCHQWRIDTINKVNKAHALIIQTIQDEYEILGKEYEVFVEKEIAHINLDKNELFQMKKGTLGSLLSTPTSITKDSKTSLDLIKERIETFAKCIDDRGNFSFQVKLPILDLHDNLRVESCFGDTTRNTSAIWQKDELVDDIPSSESKESFKTNSPPLEKDVKTLSDHCDSTHRPTSSSSTNALQNHPRRTRRQTTALPIRLPASINTERFSNEYPWFYNRTKSTSSFIQ